MLQNLTIIDLAVVKKLDLDLEKGMSVLTGETGAGKSILLTALGLALGDRADSGYIRPDCARAEIILQFDLSDSTIAKQWLQENDLDEEQGCFVRRVISQDGRSKAYINNRPVTLQSLQELSEKLVEIHGQHAHLTLLHAEEQRRLLDEYGKNRQLLKQVNDIYQNWDQARRELDQLTLDSQDKTAREELLRYQINELEQLDLENYDYQALSEEHARQANLGQILASGRIQLDLLYENEQQSVNQMLGHVINELIELTQFSPELNEMTELLTGAQIQIEESSLGLRRYLDSQEIDTQRLDWLESQIGMIQSFSRKHQVTPDELPELARNLTDELENLTHNAERIEELNSCVERLAAEYDELATQLSKKRNLTADKLQIEISSIIRELGMPQGDFEISITRQPGKSPKPNGLDKIEFLVSANPGLPAKPLAKVSSGGELSRISLAIQVATSSDRTTPTMIFDEVDSGIGGGIAEIVGKRLRLLSDNRQILCVTHLPQVASQAHHHLYVEKTSQDKMTSSNVRALSNQERVDEVARMLGGVTMTGHTIAHAKEMLEAGNST